MRAAVVAELGQAPVVGERDEPRRAPGSALVRVVAAALNPIDLLISGGGHPAGRPQPSHVPGVEGVGTVVESDTLAPGTRVRVSVPGGFVDGTLAEYLTAPDAACLPVPDALDDDLAAAVGVVGISALIGLRDEAALRPGESVLVFGATGAFGQAFVHLARVLGAERVIAAGRDEARLAALSDLCDGTVLLDRDPAGFAAALEKAGGPVDVVVDPLWGPYVQAALAGLRPTGRLLNVGQVAGAEAAVDAGALRHSRLKVLGLSGGTLTPEQSAAAYAEVAGYAAAGRLDLALEVHPLDDVAGVWAAQAASPGRKLVLRP
ncbi:MULTISPECIES: zinc-binding alcohol dehydrogenase family protein [Streptacidiphilus]|uniref:Zinc-binding alcohol dehydrogenase family protein n=1 Tax=Streptacidiphilus cavernicola TaxID=3342716 RepID=A0ABV6UH58_9ACTN|nr:zinc-binding alcohol dehydrogenase family protein [Streptacidiphilus jeojiense]